MYPDRQKEFCSLTSQIKRNSSVDIVLAENYERRFIAGGKNDSG